MNIGLIVTKITNFMNTEKKETKCRHSFNISYIDTEQINAGSESIGYFYKRVVYVVCEKCGEVKKQLI